jgi:hypothetical protein
MEVPDRGKPETTIIDFSIIDNFVLTGPALYRIGALKTNRHFEVCHNPELLGGQNEVLANARQDLATACRLLSQLFSAAERR